MFECRTSLGGLEKLIANLGNITSEAIRANVANIIKEEIQQQTAAHTDVNNQPFAPYVPKYEQWRTRHGYSAAVDLRITGALLESLVVETKGIVTTIGVTDDKKPIAEGLSQKRKFIGISDRTRARVIDSVRQQIQQALQK